MTGHVAWSTCELGGVGTLTLVTLDGERLAGVRLPEGRGAALALPEGSVRDDRVPVLRSAAEWLADYASGGRPDPTDLPPDPYA